MPLTQSKLQEHLKISVEFFTKDPDALEMPFMHSFPQNACERSAALLCVALRTKYPESKVYYVKGRNQKNSAMHFWVEVDRLVIDPTAHQFPEHSGPLLCTKPSPLEKTFIRESEITHPEDETDLPYNSNGKWHTVLNALLARIET